MRRILFLLGLLVVWFALPVQGQPPSKVVLGEVLKQEVATTQTVTGVLYYERVSEISTETTGLVEEITVSEGDRVKKGELLVRLNTDILEKEIALSETRIKQAELRIKNAEKNFKRLQTLYSSSGVSEKDYDDAEYSYQDAIMEKRALGDQLAKQHIQMQRSKIKAPFDGVVLTKGVDAGAWVQQGKVLVSLGSSDDLFVRAPIAEDLLKFINLGEKVQLILNAFDREVEGTMIAIDPVADIKTKNIFVKIKVAPMEIVAQNMSATVHVPASAKRVVSLIDRVAIVKFQGKDFIYTVKDGKASILPINIIAYLGQKVAVDNDYIVPGLPVVVEGNERLRPDQPVVVAGGS